MVNLISVVVNYKTDHLLEKFLASYDKYVARPDRILAICDVENLNSAFNHRPDMLIQFGDNVGYARAANLAAASLGGLYKKADIAVFNADTEFIDENCVDSCLELLHSDSNIGVVGPLQTTKNGKVTHAGIFGTNEQPLHRGWMDNFKDRFRDVQEAVTVSGSAFFVKREVWDLLTSCTIFQDSNPNALGAFLETPLFYEETYLSYHAREHGFKVVYNGKAEMIHEWHKSVEDNQIYADRVYKESREMFRKACDSHGILRD